MRPEKKQRLEQRRRWRIRRKITGTAERPRMSVRFTGRHIYVQFIDDQRGATIAATSTRSKLLADKGPWKANFDSASKLGVVAAEVAKASGIKKVVFDRSGALYHGKVKALADAARQAGLEF